MRILQINITYGHGSTGVITKLIADQLIDSGHEAFMAYDGYDERKYPNSYPIGNKLSYRLHAHLFTRVLDREGRGSFFATLGLCRWMKSVKPDIIHLHNIHGSYVNLSLLFNYINSHHIPVVMTLHDCWTMTGHCYHFDDERCERWKNQCHDCPLHGKYPVSVGPDCSYSNYLWKRNLFTSVENMYLVPVSQFIDDAVSHSFLAKYPHSVLHNGIDLSVFKATENNIAQKLNIGTNKIVVLGVSSGWSKEKGLQEMILLSRNPDLKVILVGVQESLVPSLPQEIVPVRHTENQQQLVEYYTMADVFVNPTYNDSFPTVNLEALACGTPVVTYKTGGSPETIDEHTGIVVERGNAKELENAIFDIMAWDRNDVRRLCRNRAELYFNQQYCYKPYLNIYRQLYE